MNPVTARLLKLAGMLVGTAVALEVVGASQYAAALSGTAMPAPQAALGVFYVLWGLLTRVALLPLLGGAVGAQLGAGAGSGPSESQAGHP